jgi:hypothetical protein
LKDPDEMAAMPVKQMNADVIQREKGREGND